MPKKLLVGGIVAIIIVVTFTGLVLTTVHNNTVRPLANVSNAFLSALRDGHYDQAYALCDASLQKDLGGVGGLQSSIESLHGIPVRWNLVSYSGDNVHAEITGDVTFVNGRSGTSTITVNYINNIWQVVLYRYSFQPIK